MDQENPSGRDLSPFSVIGKLVGGSLIQMRLHFEPSKLTSGLEMGTSNSLLKQFERSKIFISYCVSREAYF